MRNMSKEIRPVAECSSAGGEAATRPVDLREEGGSTPTPALQSQATFGPKDLLVRPVPHAVARDVCERGHYLHTYPGGTLLSFGVYVGSRLLGVAVLGVGPANLARLFTGAQRREVVCLSRLWLDDRIGRNGESRTLAIILRSLRQRQSLIRAVVAYSDPAAGHSGSIYRGAGLLYLGLSEAMPLYKLPDGSVHHSRSLSQVFGTHSRRHFAAHGVSVELVPQQRKFIYAALIDPSWRERLTRPVLAYPKQEANP